MHIPDGLIHNNVTGPALGSAAAFAALAFRQVYHRVTKRIAVAAKRTVTVPQINSTKTISRVAWTTPGKLILGRILGMTGIIFMFQLIDVPLVAGMPGHLLGGAMAALILGPWAAMATLAVVLSIQAIMMDDGGIIALGMNFLTMGVVSVWSAWGLTRLSRKKSLLIIGMGTFVSVVTAALTTTVFLNFNTGVFGGTAAEFILTHCIVGSAEALATVALIMVLKKRGWTIAVLTEDSTNQQ